MAIFGGSHHAGPKPAKKPIINSRATIIADGTLLTGEIALEHGVYFDGKLEGKIRCNEVITVGKNGEIRGEITARHLVVQGRVDGTISVERIEIKEGGRVSGTLVSNDMIIEANGVFDGESRLRNSPAPQEMPPGEKTGQA